MSHVCGGASYLNITDSSLQLQYVSLFQTGWFFGIHVDTSADSAFSANTQSFRFYAEQVIYTCDLHNAGPESLPFTAITFTSGASLFGLTMLPLWYFAFLVIVALAYMLLTTVVENLLSEEVS
mgnify:CR=1 FL=1